MPPAPKTPPQSVALYARYSTDLQREASIADQLRMCEEYVAKEGGSWRIDTATRQSPARA